MLEVEHTGKLDRNFMWPDVLDAGKLTPSLSQ